MNEWEFEVKREQLPRSDGTDTGYDAIFRGDDGQQLAVVGRDYQLVTHDKVVNSLHSHLDAIGVNSELFRYDLTYNGSKLMYELRLPGYEFKAGGDDHQPTIKLWNSLNRTRAYNLDLGLWTKICSNGLMGYRSAFNLREVHTRDRIRLEQIGRKLQDQIVLHIEDITRRSKELANKDAKKFIKLMLDSFPVQFVHYVAEELVKHGITFEHKAVGGIQKPIKMIGYNEISAYVLLQILTAVATHKIKGAVKRQQIDARIGEFMGI